MALHDWTELADYNGRVARGIAHTPKYVARMRAMQAEFDLANGRSHEPYACYACGLPVPDAPEDIDGLAAYIRGIVAIDSLVAAVQAKGDENLRQQRREAVLVLLSSVGSDGEIADKIIEVLK